LSSGKWELEPWPYEKKGNRKLNRTIKKMEPSPVAFIENPPNLEQIGIQAGLRIGRNNPGTGAKLKLRVTPQRMIVISIVRQTADS
jgi:hypothetical protein